MIAEFLRDKPRDHLAMLAAIVLIFVAQFFPYGDGSSARLVGKQDHSTDVLFNFGLDGTGWDLHPQAYVILVVLAVAFLRSDIYNHPLMQKYGWWLALVLLFFCDTPGAPFMAFGAALGMIGQLIALGAAIVHQIARVRGPKAAPKP